MHLTKGRYTASVRRNGDSYLVIVTRDGDCLPGIPSRSYADLERAKTGALRMMAKAAA